MTLRRLALTNKKVRNIPRRLRALAAWAADFDGYFPEHLTAQQKYSNWKIPVITSLVEGKQATTAIRKECAQSMIDAAHHLIMARPKDALDCRIVACICLPSMFSSEICIYTDLEYHRSHIPSADSGSVENTMSLAADWGLVLPEGVKERGLSYMTEDWDDQPYEEHQWYFGEVD
ncbi:DUF3916 domain-containing protein [Pseudomonas sp. P2757]|uniref:DUF3916 domain-containing protein n=1 Tax=unclassified Pseudomonas TaxID=196821 RepID=UPI003B5C7AC2